MIGFIVLSDNLFPKIVFIMPFHETLNQGISQHIVVILNEFTKLLLS